jgi:hypothetical protein
VIANQALCTVRFYAVKIGKQQDVGDPDRFLSCKSEFFKRVGAKALQNVNAVSDISHTISSVKVFFSIIKYGIWKINGLPFSKAYRSFGNARLF